MNNHRWSPLQILPILNYNYQNFHPQTTLGKIHHDLNPEQLMDCLSSNCSNTQFLCVIRLDEDYSIVIIFCRQHSRALCRSVIMFLSAKLRARFTRFIVHSSCSSGRYCCKRLLCIRVLVILDCHTQILLHLQVLIFSFG